MASADAVFERFDIEFDAGPEPIFHGGELITGSLKVNLKQQVTIKAIRLQFKGRACWLGDSAKGAEVEKVYFDKDFVLLERPPGHPEPGHFPWIANFTYSLPFECPLPKGCPTSYEGPQAFIRYYARATFQTDEVDSKQYMAKKGFTIVSPPELHHLLPPQSDPVSVKETVTFGGCCCRGKVTAEVSLPKTTYAPGENVVGNFTVDNRYSRAILDQVEVRLVDRVYRASTDGEQHSGKPVVNHRTVLQRKIDTNDVIKSKQTVTREDVLFLTIPPVCPSTGDPITAHSSPENFPIIRDGKASALLESPSTATLKFRKQPFIKINYAVQVSLGNRVLIEVPIIVHPIPIYQNGIEFRPFAAGVQPIGESDETDKKLVNGPFKFEPLYPTYEVPPPPALKPIRTIDEFEVAPIPNGNVELSRQVEISELPDGSHAILTKEEIVIVREVTKDDHHHHQVERAPELEHHPIETPTELVRPEPEPVIEHQLEEELATEPVEEEPLVRHYEPEPSVAISRAPEIEETQNEESEGSVIIHETEHNGVHEPHVEHEEHDYDLANGHVHTVTETIEDGPTKTQKKIETYEYTDEDGVHVEVHRSEETHISNDGITIENGGTPQIAE